MRFTCIYYNEKERKNLSPFIECLKQRHPEHECRVIEDYDSTTVDDDASPHIFAFDNNTTNNNRDNDTSHSGNVVDIKELNNINDMLLCTTNCGNDSNVTKEIVSTDDIIIVCSLRKKKRLMSQYNIYYLDHGTSFLKDFIHDYLYPKNVNFFFCNPVLHRLAENIIGNKMDPNFISGYINTDIGMCVSDDEKNQYCLSHNLDPTKPLIFYAPTYITRSNLVNKDYDTIKQQLQLLSATQDVNVYTVQHTHGTSFDFCNNIPNIGNNCNIGLIIADIVISDTSSMLFEALSIGKKVIQVLLKTYSGNKNSGNYQVPLIPNIDQPFIGGVCTLPWHLCEIITNMLRESVIFNYAFPSPQSSPSPLCSSPQLLLQSKDSNVVDDSNVVNNIPEQVGIISYGATREDGKNVHEHIIDQIVLFEQYKQDHGYDKVQFKTKNVYLDTAPVITIDEYQSWFAYPKCIKRKQPGEKIVLTFGTFDMFHIGHLNILERASKLGTHLIVGVSSDELNYRKKNRNPIINQTDRMRIVNSLKFVDYTFCEHRVTELKRHYLHMYQADVLVMGDDWQGRMDHYKDICEVVYLPRTTDISTTDLIAKIQNLDI